MPLIAGPPVNDLPRGATVDYPARSQTVKEPAQQGFRSGVRLYPDG